MNKEVNRDLSKIVAQPIDFTPEEALEHANRVGNRPSTVRTAEYELERLRTALDPVKREEVAVIFEDLNGILSPEMRQFQLTKRNQFRTKLRRVIERFKTDTFEYPHIGGRYQPAHEINHGSLRQSSIGVVEAGRPDLMVPESITKDDLIQLAELKYMVEAMGIDHIVSGFARSLVQFYRAGKIPRPTDLHFILRDGKVPYAALRAMAKQDPNFLPAELAPRIRASYINSAMAQPFVSDPDSDAPNMIYTPNENAITTEQAITFFTQLGILGQKELAFILLADTASMGTIPIALDKARQSRNDNFKMAMIAIAGGWQGSPHIPNYTRYLATGRWLADPNNQDPIVLKKCEIIHTYMENNFSGYSKRPNSLRSEVRHGKEKLIPPVQPFNDATSIISYVSLQAAKDAGELHGILHRNQDPVADVLPQRTLEYFWSMWTHSVGPNPTMPNIAFNPFITKHSGMEGIAARWHDRILENIDWDAQE